MKVAAPPRWLRVSAGLAVVAALIALPVPNGSRAGPPPAPAVSGPATLSSTWPQARPFTLPAVLPDGSAYSAELILDPATSVGLATSTDGRGSSLVVVSTGRPVRVLQSRQVHDGGSYDAVTASADRLFWSQTANDQDGHPQVSLWNAARSGGPAQLLTSEVGEPRYYGSRYDIQVAGGRLYWMSAVDSQPGRSELRSVATTGGAVDVRSFDQPWQLSGWPWLVTAPNATGAAMRLYNVDTGQTVAVDAPPSQLINCSRSWCRFIPASSGPQTDLIRPDGSDRHRIADPKTTPIASDVALLGRFEPLLTTVTSNASLRVSRLTLYDIARRRSVVIEAAVTKAKVSGDVLIWATGDNETLAWHGLDLNTLH